MLPCEIIYIIFRSRDPNLPSSVCYRSQQGFTWLFFCLLLLQHYIESRGWACFRLQENVQFFYCRNRVSDQCSDERLNWELIYILILLKNILSGFFDSLEFQSFIVSHWEGSSEMATRWVFALRQSISILSTWNGRDAFWTLETVRISILMISLSHLQALRSSTITPNAMQWLERNLN